MQREITQAQTLLDKRGVLLKPGYARKMMFEYNSKQINAGPFSLKEWDFYQAISGDYVLQLTIGHVSYVASFSAMLFNIKTGEKKSFARMKPLPMRNGINFPLNPEQPNVLEVKGGDYTMRFETRERERVLTVRADDKKLGSIDIDITLNNDPDNEKMVIATPFFKSNQFYLNYKENYYGLAGRAQLGDMIMQPGENDTALLDWGRGVWPYRHEWFWGNGSGFVNSGKFGFNIGWGFGDLKHASENMFFWNGRAYKLDTLTVERDGQDYMKPWHFTDTESRFDFTMTPVYDRYTENNLLVINTHCHQIFGNYSGTAKLPDGEIIEVKNLTAFCEHAENRW
jgi:hypothetical protein